jgi:hypothetical protein
MVPLRAVVPAAVLACAVLLAGLLYALDYREQYRDLLQYWGAFPFRFPFLDMHAVTSAVECHRLGYDVYVQNPCDVFGRVHGYSPLWLWLAVFPISTAWDNVFALATVALFLAALLFLPPGRGWWQCAVITLATISSAVAFALERANVDLLIFVLAVVAIALTGRGRQSRILGYAVALLAGMLKFYPVTLLILATRERLSVFAAVGIVALGVLAVWFVLDADDILRAMANIPETSDFDDNVFGMRDLPFGLARSFGLPRSVGVILLVVLLAVVLAASVALARQDDLGSRVRSLTAAEARCLMVGCVLIVSCFLAAQNVQYRATHLLFVLPGLTVLARPRGRRVGDCAYPVLVALIVVLLWSGAIDAPIDAALARSGVPTLPDGITHFYVWLVRELVWWVVVTMLSGLMLRLMWNSEARRGVGHLLVTAP